MSELFILNARPQNFRFTFSMKGIGERFPFTFDLPRFSYKRFYKDTDTESLKSLLRQIYEYGLQEYEPSLKNTRYSGFTYRFDQDFTNEELQKLKYHYHFCVKHTGEERRIESLSKYASIMSGVAINLNKNSLLNELLNDPKNLGTSIVQQNPYEDGSNFEALFSVAYQ